ncbi:MAG TPA: ABC transporter substrate-binding protein [bacterium]|nr:ABC transporter substrate-binding protein [bacterium]
MRSEVRLKGWMKSSFKLTIAVAAVCVIVTAAGCKPSGGASSGGGKPFPELKLLYNTSEAHRTIAEAIQRMWAQELGIKVELNNVEWKVYQKNLQALDYDIARAGWIGDYPDPNTFLDMFVTNGGNNQTGWSNKKYDDLIAAAAKEPDIAKRAKLLADAEDILVNKEMPIMPIYFYVNTNLIKSYVKNMELNARDLHPLKEVYIEKGGKILPPDKQVFRFSNHAEPESIDPEIMTGNVEFNIAQQLYEGLVVNDPKTLDPIPGMATSWDVSPDKKTYVFHLRKNATWSNGDPFTAEDFVYSWKRVLTPSTASEYAYQLFYVKNGKPYYEGKIKDFKQVGISAPDPYTLKVELENPTAYWLDLVTFHTLMPVNKKCVEKYGYKWTRPENIVTNGPFLLKEWAPKDHITMVKNPRYYDADKVRLTKLIAYPIEVETTNLQMFESGEIDWMNTIPPSHMDKVKKWEEAHFTPFLSTYYYRFNVTKPPLNDPRVRKALDLAVNKKEICEYVTKAGQKPATTFVPPILKNYKSPEGLEYNPDLARKLLREAGYAVNVKK